MIDPKYLDAIKRFEGFTKRGQWDYSQSSNGYGTVAKFDGEVIDRAEAERRFKAEIGQAYDLVDRFAPSLDDGSKAALTSLTFNAGTAWTRSGLGLAIQSGDMAAAQQIFKQYNNAGGQPLAGLTARRSTEVLWFGQAMPDQQNFRTAQASYDSAADTLATIASDDRTRASIAGQEHKLPMALTSTPVDDAPFGPTAVAATSLGTEPALARSAGVMLANLLAFLSIGRWQVGAEQNGKKQDDDRAIILSTTSV